MQPSRLESHLSEIQDQGYTIVRDAIEPPLVKALVEQIRKVEQEMGAKPKGNPAEGYATLRTYNLLARGEVFQSMPVHDNVLPIVEGVLDRGCLLSGMTAIDIGPGEVCQPIHPDDIVMSVERPHAPLMCTTMWALTEFSDANGGTRAVPGSHRYDHAPDFQAEIETIPIEMPAGSVMIFDASLWHGGGSNRTDDEWRLGVNVQFCAGFIRPQQNQYLGVPRDITRTFSDRLLELCGYSLYKGIMGHIDTKSPAVVLGDGRLDQTAYADSRSSDWVDEE